MRVLHVNFASIERSPGEAGGITGYTANLAREERDLGHAVGMLSSGVAYSVEGARPKGTAFLRMGSPVEGIDRIEIVNSPFLAPAIWNFSQADREIESPELDEAIREAVLSWRADVVHFHSLEGLAASCIGAAKAAGARVFMSLHNHHPFCPQVYLMHRRRSPCLDYKGGLRCADCEAGIDVNLEKQRRAGRVACEPPSIPPPPMTPIIRFEETGSLETGSRSLVESGHEWWESLSNEIPAPVAARHFEHPFGERRHAMVRALNECDRVLAVSDFVGSLVVSMGVERERILVQPIAGVQRSSCVPRDRSDGLLKIVFLGFNNYYKGLHMLVDAIGMLPASLRSRVHLAAFGTGCLGIRERAEAIRPGLAGLELGGPYEPSEIPRLLSGHDIGVVPSVWWDNGPQTLIEMLNAGLPALGANLGGIPDLIRHEQNGMLFRGNDRKDAARQIERLLTEPGLVERLRAGVHPGPTMAEHAREVVDLYARSLQSPLPSAQGRDENRRS
ncbi:MAG: glycosyltransferase [Phycisphaerales bacterium]|nr:glycosyltransferase [Phycisphaerales bacterium]MCB9836289.1 glycosyltransferase [Phycisphaera sp.]